MPKLTYAKLPREPKGAFLYCPSCGASYSAQQGDYFQASPIDEVRCGEPACSDEPLRLVRISSRLVNVRPEA